MTKFKEDKEALYSIVETYEEMRPKRDYSDVRQMIKDADSEEAIEILYQLTDSWIDY
jgi:hypothetical protein